MSCSIWSLVGRAEAMGWATLPSWLACGLIHPDTSPQPPYTTHPMRLSCRGRGLVQMMHVLACNHHCDCQNLLARVPREHVKSSSDASTLQYSAPSDARHATQPPACSTALVSRGGVFSIRLTLCPSICAALASASTGSAFLKAPFCTIQQDDHCGHCQRACHVSLMYTAFSKAERQLLIQRAAKGLRHRACPTQYRFPVTYAHAVQCVRSQTIFKSMMEASYCINPYMRYGHNSKHGFGTVSEQAQLKGRACAGWEEGPGSIG